MGSHSFHTHDHDQCIITALDAAQGHCDAQRLNFTPIRRRVLEILLAEHRALGAYDILAKLSEEGAAAQPPIAYRALDFLVSHGFAHKIEHLNAYIACAQPRVRHAPAILICRACAAIEETTTQIDAGTLAKVAKSADFTIERAVIEIEGICPKCRDAAA